MGERKGFFKSKKEKNQKKQNSAQQQGPKNET